MLKRLDRVGLSPHDLCRLRERQLAGEAKSDHLPLKVGQAGHRAVHLAERELAVDEPFHVHE